ncbi:MarR family winged helix-turn-helix transcriptional regulator [Corynebacterium frankenforstense]
MNALTPEIIARRMRPALTKLYVMYFRVAEQSDLTGPQLSILSRLSENGPSRISQIAREEGIRMPTASNALHQLEQRGMVERLRDTTDRRGVRVRLTDHGAEELKRVGEERNAYFADLLRSLDEKDLEVADQATDVINRLAEAYGNRVGDSGNH